MKNSYPITYLVMPFSISGDSHSKSHFEEYLVKCDFEMTMKWKHISLKPSKNVEGEEKPLFRGSTFFDIMKQYFGAFKGAQGGDECEVLRLKDTDSFRDRLLYFKNPYVENEYIKGKIQCHNNSIDTIMLIINRCANVGLFILPIIPEVELEDLQDFMNFARITGAKNVKDCLDKEACQSLNEIAFNPLMAEFDGYYQRFNIDYAHHFTFVLLNQAEITDNCKEILTGVTRCKGKTDMFSVEPCASLKLSNTVLIGAAQDGTTVITTEEINDENMIPKQVLNYGLENRERFVVLVMSTLQRYILLRVISELAKSDINNNNSLDDLRNKVHIVCETKIKNSFTSISDFPENNKLYRLCCESYELDKLYKEIDEKMKGLDSHLSQISKEKRIIADRQLSILVAIIAVTSATNDVLDLTKELLTKEAPWKFIVVIVFFIFVVAIIVNNFIKTRK